MIGVTLKDKAEIRKKVLSIRDHIPPEVRAVKDGEIMERLCAYRAFIDAEVVMLFASFRSEVNTFPIIEYTLRGSKRVVLPKVNREKRELELYVIESLDDLSEGCMGILEPDPLRCSPIERDSIDLIVLPGVAFDLRGGRIGYGGGYYDRLIGSLQTNPLLIATAYEEQIMEEMLPMAPHDKRVNTIITDRRIIEVADGQ